MLEFEVRNTVKHASITKPAFWFIFLLKMPNYSCAKKPKFHQTNNQNKTRFCLETFVKILTFLSKIVNYFGRKITTFLRESRLFSRSLQFSCGNHDFSRENCQQRKMQNSKQKKNVNFTRGGFQKTENSPKSRLKDFKLTSLVGEFIQFLKKFNAFLVFYCSLTN